MFSATTSSSLELRPSDASVSFQVVPRGGFDLVLVPDDAVVRLTQQSGSEVMTGSFVAGASTSLATGSLAGSGEIFVTHLSMLDAHAVLGVPLSNLARRLTRLDDIDYRLANQLRQALSSHKEVSFSSAQKIMAHRAASKRLSDSNLVEAALHRIAATRGSERIGALASSLQVSRRKLERAFAELIGLPPKAIASLVRADSARRHLRNGMPITQAALAAGYFDHAHLCRDLMRITGRTPAVQTAC